MTQLDEFFNYKNRLMEDLLTNEEVVRLLSDDGETPEDPAALMYTRVFPFEYVPPTIEHGYTYLCCDVDIRRAINKTYLIPTLYVWIFAHRSKLRLPRGGVRMDALAAEIARTIGGSRYYGLGELELDSVQRFVPIDDYQGRQLTFYARDFNRLHPTGMPVPSNRRAGV